MILLQQEYEILCTLERHQPLGLHFNGLFDAVNIEREKRKLARMSRDDFDKHLRVLKKQGYVIKEDYRYGKHRITSEGIDALSKKVNISEPSDFRSAETHYFGQKIITTTTPAEDKIPTTELNGAVILIGMSSCAEEQEALKYPIHLDQNLMTCRIPAAILRKEGRGIFVASWTTSKTKVCPKCGKSVFIVQDNMCLECAISRKGSLS